jgi:hypothetical protein
LLTACQLVGRTQGVSALMQPYRTVSLLVMIEIPNRFGILPPARLRIFPDFYNSESEN